MEAEEILRHFYPEDTPFRRMLLKHSTQVRDKALAILQLPKAQRLGMNAKLAADGALLHDIGIGRCHAPSILCCGTEPYIAHGMIGAGMLREFAAQSHQDLEAFARICERHTGAGLTKADIISQNLPLPQEDFLPETLEEKLICLSDKFFSKSGDMEEKSLPRVRKSLEKFGPETQLRLEEMLLLFGVEQ